MDKRISVAAIALAAAMGFAAGNITGEEPQQPVQVSDVNTLELLDHATQQCADLIRAHNELPVCRIEEVNTPRGKKQGWVCNGAYMGAAAQACLDAALEAMVTP